MVIFAKKGDMTILSKTLTTFLFPVIFGNYSGEEMTLYKNINSYRAEKGLPALELSDSLSFVAKLHCINLYENHDYFNRSCSLHTWYPSSDSSYKWNVGCYGWGTPNPPIMWFKPKEILGMNCIGYEIAHIHYPKDQQCNARCCLQNWKQSTGHNNVIIENGWRPFKKIGISIYKGIATVWFSQN